MRVEVEEPRSQAQQTLISRDEEILGSLRRKPGLAFLAGAGLSDEEFVLTSERLYHRGTYFGLRKTGRLLGFGKGRAIISLSHITAFGSAWSINFLWLVTAIAGFATGLYSIVTRGSDSVAQAMLPGFLICAVSVLFLFLSLKKKFTVTAGDVNVGVAFRAVGGAEIPAFETALALAVEKALRRETPGLG